MYVRSRRQNSVGVSTLKYIGQLVSDSKETAPILVDQFQSVFTRDDDQQLPRHLEDSQTANIISSYNHNTAKAQGPDLIANIMRKTFASQFAIALTNIFQRSIDSGKLPSDWLNDNISPVYKKGDVYLSHLEALSNNGTAMVFKYDVL